MKAVVMAAGKGVRMLPLTKRAPKVFIKINKKPFLYYVLKHLQDAGFEDIGIIVGYKKEQFPKFLEKYGFKAILIEQDEQKGTGHAMKLAKDFAGNENFIVLGGDNLWSVNDLRSMAVEDNLCYVAGIKVENPQKYGVLVTKHNKLIKIVEKPKEFVGDLINTGLYKFTPEIFEALERIKLSPRGEYELTDAISILAEKGKVRVISLEDYWLDLGCKEDIERVEKFLKALGEE
jgi:dTDP-glucose pyrophosphorylase